LPFLSFPYQDNVILSPLKNGLFFRSFLRCDTVFPLVLLLGLIAEDIGGLAGTFK